MKNNNTVLSHLAVRFAVHPEVVATEALTFILKQSPAARNALAEIARQFGVVIQEDLKFEAQSSDDAGARPDIIGKASSEGARLVIELKFWAGLSEAQPVGYIKSMPEETSLLMFVAPGLRFETLWSELFRRCAVSGITTLGPTTPRHEIRFTPVGNHVLGLVSWRFLLDSILSSVEIAEDVGTSADIRQLAGLCEKMDDDAFLPLTSDELTSAMGRRIIQFGQLAFDLTDLLVDKKLASIKGRRATGSNGYYGRPLQLKGYGCFLHFNAWHWSRWGESPLWLKIQGPDWKRSVQVLDAVAKANIVHHDFEEACIIPIMLPPGEEREVIMQKALAQLELVAKALPEIDEALLNAEFPSFEDEAN